MKHLLAPLALAALTAPLAAQTIDVNQPSATVYMAGFGQPDLAQSFIPNVANCSGAGIYSQPGIGSPEDITIELWDALPNAGGNLLASGTTAGTPGTWVDVFWSAVPVTAGNTYYLVFTSNFNSMGIAGDTANPYAGGQVYANAGFGSFPTYDYTFRTYYGNLGPTLTVTGTCPSYTFNVSNATPFGAVALLTGPNAASVVVGGTGPCAGTTLGVSPPNIRGIFGADASGSLSLTLTLPAGACGTLFLQAVDVGACAPSNVEAL
jgi:hypothetical protein